MNSKGGLKEKLGHVVQIKRETVNVTLNLF